MALFRPNLLFPHVTVSAVWQLDSEIPLLPNESEEGEGMLH